jgi:hypothetical protein
MKKCLYVDGNAEQLNASFFKSGDDPLGSPYYVKCVNLVLSNLVEGNKLEQGAILVTATHFIQSSPCNNLSNTM